jgi:hypothetical protein
MSKEQIIDLIEQNELAKAFEEIDKYGIKDPIYYRLKKEFIMGKIDIDFYNRLAMIVLSIDKKNVIISDTNNSESMSDDKKEKLKQPNFLLPKEANKYIVTSIGVLSALASIVAFYKINEQFLYILLALIGMLILLALFQIFISDKNEKWVRYWINTVIAYVTLLVMGTFSYGMYLSINDPNKLESIKCSWGVDCKNASIDYKSNCA